SEARLAGARIRMLGGYFRVFSLRQHSGLGLQHCSGGASAARRRFDRIASWIRRSGSKAKIVVVSAHPHVHESLRSVTDAFVYSREPQSSFVAAIERALDRIPSKLLTTRTIHRHAVKVPLVIEVLRSGVKTNLYGTSADLSERGIGGTVKAQFIPGEMVKVMFPLPNALTDMQAYAIVRHRRNEFYGFEFVSIDDKSLEIIRSLCAILPPLRNS